MGAMNPVEENIVISRNEDFEDEIVFSESYGTPTDLSGWSFILAVSAALAQSPESYVFSSGNGGVVHTNLVGGTVTVLVPRETLPAGSYVYDMIGIKDLKTSLLRFGTLTVEEGVSQP